MEIGKLLITLCTQWQAVHRMYSVRESQSDDSPSIPVPKLDDSLSLFVLPVPILFPSLTDSLDAPCSLMSPRVDCEPWVRLKQ